MEKEKYRINLNDFSKQTLYLDINCKVDIKNKERNIFIKLYSVSINRKIYIIYDCKNNEIAFKKKLYFALKCNRYL